jgi:gamma-glutamylcyclotransferase (GGCT)/AIG2-like uncharacterized protein YtfP
MQYLFIYGTLLDEKYNPVPDILKSSAREIASGYIKGRLFDLGEYPAAINITNNDEKVYGKILEVYDANTLFSILDAYEGIDSKPGVESEYNREKIEVIMEDGAIIIAWTYLYLGDPEGLIQIESGNYLQYIEEKMS